MRAFCEEILSWRNWRKTTWIDCSLFWTLKSAVSSTFVMGDSRAWRGYSYQAQSNSNLLEESCWSYYYPPMYFFLHGLTKFSENFHVCSPRSFLPRPSSLLWLFAGCPKPSSYQQPTVPVAFSLSKHTSKKTFEKRHLEKSQIIATNLPTLLLFFFLLQQHHSGLQSLFQSCEMSRMWGINP